MKGARFEFPAPWDAREFKEALAATLEQLGVGPFDFVQEQWPSYALTRREPYVVNLSVREAMSDTWHHEITIGSLSPLSILNVASMALRDKAIEVAKVEIILR